MSEGGLEPVYPAATNDQYEVYTPIPAPNYVIPQNLAKKLLLAQAIMSGQAVSKSGKNTHLKSAYATLSDVIELVMPTLSEVGVLFNFITVGEDAKTASIVGIFTDPESGESFNFRTSIPSGGGTAQAYGSGLTYAARYAILRFFNLKTADDDGEAAMNRAARPNPQADAMRQGREERRRNRTDSVEEAEQESYCDEVMPEVEEVAPASEGRRPRRER